MKAIRAHSFGGPETLQLDEIEDPRPGPGELVIEMRAAGLNPADTYMLTGQYAIVPPLPFIPGGDCAGVVAELGEGVTGFAPGDPVFAAAPLGRDLSGCFAEKVLRPAKDVLPLPQGADFAQAAALGIPYVTAHIALFRRGRAQAGETVFIHGASGAVGTAATQLARRAGLTVIGSAGSDAGLALVRSLGATLAVDHRAPGYLDAIRKAAPEGPALILEMLADVNLAADMALAAKFGRIVIIGCRGEVTIPPRAAMMKELDILGTAVWNAPRKDVLAALADIATGLADGSLAPVIGQRIPLADAARAYAEVLAPGRLGKIVLV